MKKLFHKCSMCKTEWKSIKKFLKDKSLQFNGFQADGKGPDTGFLLFSHLKKKCKTTMAVDVNKFADLYFKKKRKKKKKQKCK